MINAIVLDLDGPLLEGMYRHYHCYRDILLAHGFKPIPLEQYWQLKRSRANRKELLSLSHADQFYEMFLAEWLQHIETPKYLAMDQLQFGVLGILEDWKRLGIRLLLATMRNNASLLQIQLEKLGLAQFLDHVVVVGSEHAGTNKATEIEPFLRNLDRSTVIWIGDTEVDILAARELGVRICALTCGLRTADQLMSFSPDVLEADLSSFSKNRFFAL
jgi:phosphoglycolate phosphatase